MKTEDKVKGSDIKFHNYGLFALGVVLIISELFMIKNLLEIIRSLFTSNNIALFFYELLYLVGFSLPAIIGCLLISLSAYFGLRYTDSELDDSALSSCITAKVIYRKDTPNAKLQIINNDTVVCHFDEFGNWRVFCAFNRSDVLAYNFSSEDNCLIIQVNKKKNNLYGFEFSDENELRKFKEFLVEDKNLDTTETNNI